MEENKKKVDEKQHILKEEQKKNKQEKNGNDNFINDTNNFKTAHTTGNIFNFVKLSIKAKLYTVIGFIAVVLLGIIFIFHSGMGVMENSFSALQSRNKQVELIMDFNLLTEQLLSPVQSYVLVGERQEIENFQTLKRKLNEHIYKIQTNITGDDNRIILEKIKEDIKQIYEISDIIFAFDYKKTTTDDFVKHIKTAEFKVAELDIDTNQFLKHIQEYQHRAQSDFENTRIQITQKIMYTIVISLILSVLLIYFIVRGIIASTNILTSGFISVSNGDLTINLKPFTKDELGFLITMFNSMIINLRTLVQRITNASIKINSSTNEILSSTEQQVRSTTEQSSQISQINSTIVELNNNISQISKSADTMYEYSLNALELSKEGTNVVNKSREGMDRINYVVQNTASKILMLGEKSQKIEEIMSVILNVADQTNLLSLNAAIESVKAGEAGKGFGVVATEIRRLADQTAIATKSIAPLIKEIQAAINSTVISMEEGTRGVDAGVELIEKTISAFDNILTAVEETAKQSRIIVQASKQQDIAANEVSNAMNSISEASSQTAAGTKQTSSSTYELNALASQLREGVSQFKLR